MALDLGTLTAYVEVDDRKGQQTLAVMARKLQQFARDAPPDVKLGADGSRVERALADVRRLIASLPAATIDVEADGTIAQAFLRGFATEVKALPDGMVEVLADGTLAERALAGLAGDIRSLPDADVTVRADTARALAQIKAFAKETDIEALKVPVDGDVNSVNESLEAIEEGQYSAEVGVEADPRRALETLTGLTAVGQFLELLVTADDEKAKKTIKATRELAEEPAILRVRADIVKAEADLARLTRVEQTVAIDVTADPARAQRVLDRLAASGLAATIDVEADPSGAQSVLDRLAAERREAIVRVEADASAAQAELERLGEAGAAAGDEAGEGLSRGILTALTALPIAGTVVGIGVALGASIASGLQNEVRADLLAARTGLDPATVAKIGRAAGEAYAANFGESIEANFDTARVAVQSGLLDPKATSRDSQKVIESLTGVADILGEDIPRVARAAATLLRTGLVDSAEQAFDVFVKGQQNGANAAEDLLDTFTEYPAVLQRLGLTAEESLGLLSQGLQAGARDSDFVADALKEFQILATDGSEASAEAFKILGINASQATAKISRGGADARAGLDQVLDGLRGIEDPVKRNAAAVGLFGTKAEDLGASLFALDLDTVSDDLTNLEGAAAGAVSALGDNAAGQITSAGRNIEIAADGIKGALAAAFGPQISEWAQDVQENRAGIVGFLLDLANGAFDAGRALVEAAASGIEAFGRFVSDTGPDMIFTLLDIVQALDAIPGVDMSAAVESLTGVAINLAKVGNASERAAADLREELIENGIEPAQAALNEFGLQEVTRAKFHDATVALARDIGDVGYAADGAKIQLDDTSGSIDRTTEAGKLLDAQLRTAVASLEAQLGAAAAAGEETESLTSTFDANRESLVQQIQQLGFSREAAQRLAGQYGAIPSLVQTTVTLNAAQAAQGIEAYQRSLGNIPRSITTDVFIREVQRDAALASRIASGSPTTQPLLRAGGGWIHGPGTGTSDDVPLWGSNGEFVVRAAAAAKNAGLLEAINSGRIGAPPVPASSPAAAGAGGSVARSFTYKVEHQHVTAAPGERLAISLPRDMAARAWEMGYGA